MSNVKCLVSKRVLFEKPKESRHGPATIEVRQKYIIWENPKRRMSELEKKAMMQAVRDFARSDVAKNKSKNM